MSPGTWLGGGRDCMREFLVEWSNLKADYERLGSYTAVAREYGVSKGYVAQQAKAQGINPQPEGRSLR